MHAWNISVLTSEPIYIFRRKDVTHYLTAIGFTGEQVKFMTKHNMDIFLKDYCCQINIPVCKALAGFNPLNKSDEYCVPRTRLNMPGGMNIEQITSLLFPNIHTWRSELASPLGDKAQATSASHFLYKILPFLSEVCIQDGIYWIKDFPQNTAVMLLLQRLENKTGLEHYTVFAQKARLDVQKWQEEEQKMANTVDKKLVLMYDEITSLRSYCEAQFTFMQTAIAENARGGEGQYGADGLSWVSRATCNQNEGSANKAIGGEVAEGNTEQEQQQQQQQQQHHSVLRDFNHPLKPTILTLNTYGSLTRLISLRESHYHHKIDDNMPASRWNDPQRDRMNWSKLKLLYRRIDDCRGRQPDDTPMTRSEMAEWLDNNERGGMSLEKYWKWLRVQREYLPKKRKC